MSPVTHEILCHGDDQRRERGVKIRPIHRRQELSYCHSPGRFFGSIFDPSATCWDECARCIYLYGRCDCVWVAKLEVSSQKVNINLFRANPPSTSFSLRGSEASIRLSATLSTVVPLPFLPSHTLAYTRARVSRLDLHHPSSSEQASKRWIIIPNLNVTRPPTTIDPKVVTSINLFLLASPWRLWSRSLAVAIVGLGKQTPRITPGPSIGFDIQATSFDFSVRSPFLASAP